MSEAQGDGRGTFNGHVAAADLDLTQCTGSSVPHCTVQHSTAACRACSAALHSAAQHSTAVCRTCSAALHRTVQHSTAACRTCDAAGVGGGRRRKTFTEWPHTEAESSSVPEGSKARRERGWEWARK